MLVLLRGHTTFTEVSDPPAPAVTGTMERGGDLPLIAAAAAAAPLIGPVAAPQMTFSAPDFSAPNLPAAQTLFVPVMSVTAAAAGSPHPDAAINHASFAELLARGGDAPVVVLEPLNFASVSSNGWFIVPSAANEYGDSYASADGFTWDVAAGEFSADWFFV